MMTKGSRILVLVAALALGLVYVLPVWRITLEAPQYPEGLGMVIRVNTIVGVKQHDLSNINNLNHYIGMKRIEPESIPELRIMPVVVGVLMGLGLLVAALGRRKALYAWVGVFMVVALGGMADFWKWEYDYGHDLDQENAIIKVPGMSYQPPLIGSRQILNFKAHSWPGAGGWIAIAVGALAVGTAVSERRRARRARPGAAGVGSAGPVPEQGGGAAPVSGPAPEAEDGASRGSGAAVLTTLAMLAAVGASACGEPGPREIVFGADSCERCLMGVTDDGHAAQAVSGTGRAWIFDSVECLVAWLDEREDTEEVRSLWVTDFSNPPTMVRADEAFFLVSPTLSSPMGLGLTAFARLEDRDGAVNAFGGRAVSWGNAVGLVRERWPGGQPPHGGHQSSLEPGPAPSDPAHAAHGG